MRDALRELEGQLVVIRGKVSEVKRHDNKRFALIVKPKIFPWDGFTAINKILNDKSRYVKVDHLWCELRRDDPTPLYTAVFGCSRVSWYTRKDASIDLGVQPMHVMLNCDHLVHDSIEAFTDRAKTQREAYNLMLEAMDYTLESLKHQGEIYGDRDVPAWTYSSYLNSDQIKRWIARNRKSLELDIACLDRAEAGCAKRGRCKSAGSFADLMR